MQANNKTHSQITVEEEEASNSSNKAEEGVDSLVDSSSQVEVVRRSDLTSRAIEIVIRGESGSDIIVFVGIECRCSAFIYR